MTAKQPTQKGKAISVSEKREFVYAKMQYIKNCVLYLEFFVDGTNGIVSCEDTIKHLKQHCIDIQNKLNS